MDQMCRIGFDPSGDFQRASCALRMNRLDFEVDFGLFGLDRRNIVSTAGQQKDGAEKRRRDALQRMNAFHGLISVCAA
jgi:hypothetical protein